MKNLIIILIVFAACKKPSTPVTPATPTPSGAVAKFMPNWWNNDTLYGTELDANNTPTGKYDTIITKTVNDTSFIVYRGKQYYIWVEPATATDTFKTDKQQYVNIVISPDKNINNAISKSLLNSASGHKYKDQQGNWSYQSQAIMLNDWKNFKKVNMGFYQSKRQYP